MSAILFFTCLLLLMLLHEAGHAIVALCLGYRVERLQFAPGSIFPYLSVQETRQDQWCKNLFLAGGTLMTLLLFFLAASQSFWLQPWLFYALVLQIAMETNPFFSDWSMMLFRQELQNNDQGRIVDLKNKIQELWFTKKWYCHFLAWSTLIISFLSLKVS
jgi:hypothetical protein